jgi:superoxide dismutase, Cu-Zn family
MRFMATAVLAMAAIGCSDTTTVGRPGDTTVNVAQWSTDLVGNPGWEHLSGSAEVDTTLGTNAFTAVTELHGDDPGAERPWHVHFGTCATSGGIVGDASDYPALVVGADGSAEATASVGTMLEAKAAYHVNVHLADDDLATLIACGDLVPRGAPPPDDDDDDGGSVIPY